MLCVRARRPFRLLWFMLYGGCLSGIRLFCAARVPAFCCLCFRLLSPVFLSSYAHVFISCPSYFCFLPVLWCQDGVTAAVVRLVWRPSPARTTAAAPLLFCRKETSISWRLTEPAVMRGETNARAEAKNVQKKQITGHRKFRHSNTFSYLCPLILY